MTRIREEEVLFMAGSLRNGGPDGMVWYGVSGNRMKLIRDIQLEYCDVCG